MQHLPHNVVLIKSLQNFLVLFSSFILEYLKYEKILVELNGRNTLNIYSMTIYKRIHTVKNTSTMYFMHIILEVGCRRVVANDLETPGVKTENSRGRIIAPKNADTLIYLSFKCYLMLPIIYFKLYIRLLIVNKWRW